MVLPKADGMSNAAARALAGKTHQGLMHRVRRFPEKWLDGLKTESGHGRKRVPEKKEGQAVRDAIRKHRQGVKMACAEVEKPTGKKLSKGTPGIFLSALAQDLDV